MMFGEHTQCPRCGHKTELRWRDDEEEMNIESVKAMVERIAAEECEEDQHIMEDKLYEQFVRFVATSSQDATLKEMAGEILKTKNLDMNRHYA